jgi:hypothetical protein
MLFYNQYPTFTPFTACSTFCSVVNPNPNPLGNIITYITFRRIPDNPVITPGSNVQVVTPSSMNHYLQSVTVKAVTTPPTP